VLPSKGAPFPKEKSFMGAGGLAALCAEGPGAGDADGLAAEKSGGSWVGVACCAAHPAMTITHIVEIVWTELGMMLRRVAWRAQGSPLTDESVFAHRSHQRGRDRPFHQVGAVVQKLTRP
jgi:hypothetical protein